MSEDRLSIVEATITSQDGKKVFEIQKAISDMEIFEHLDKPYLTGTVSFLDTTGVFDDIIFKGEEKFQVGLKFPYLTSEPVRKTFIIDKILSTAKKNEKAELVTFHIIEEIGFISTFLNVNKAYEGGGREIIEKIFSDYFDDYELSKADEDELADMMQVVVPNMQPLEACNWIKDRTTSGNGSPFYLFSTLSNKQNIHFIPLSTMLQRSNVKQREYIYSQALSNTDDRNVRPYVIEDYRVRKGADLSSLISKSLIGAEYSFLDIATANPNTLLFNSIDRFNNNQELQALGTKDFAFQSSYEYKNKKLNEISSRKTFKISGSRTYLNHTNYNDFPSNSNIVWAKALRDIITSNPIDVAVSGQTFLNPNVNKTIGNVISIRFLNNNLEQSNRDLTSITDKVKSGKHLVYAARHIIRKEKYDVVLSCVKLENLK